jgi:hypothetical protein
MVQQTSPTDYCIYCYISEPESCQCSCHIIPKAFRICFNCNEELVDLHYVASETLRQACENASNVASILFYNCRNGGRKIV